MKSQFIDNPLCGFPTWVLSMETSIPTSIFNAGSAVRDVLFSHWRYQRDCKQVLVEVQQRASCININHLSDALSHIFLFISPSFFPLPKPTELTKKKAFKKLIERASSKYHLQVCSKLKMKQKKTKCYCLQTAVPPCYLYYWNLLWERNVSIVAPDKAQNQDPSLIAEGLLYEVGILPNL